MFIYSLVIGVTIERPVFDRLGYAIEPTGRLLKEGQDVANGEWRRQWGGRRLAVADHGKIPARRLPEQ